MCVKEELVLFLDVGNVLLRFDKGRAFSALAQLCNKRPDPIKEHVERESLEGHFETGMSCDTFADALRRIMEASPTNQELKHAWSNIFQSNGIVPSRLASMCERHHLSAMLFSDTDPWRADEIQRRLAEWPYYRGLRLVYSFNVGSLKADGTSLCDEVAKLGLGRKAILLDDLPTNIQAALAAGALGLQFEGDASIEVLDHLVSNHTKTITAEDLNRTKRALYLVSQMNALINRVLVNNEHLSQARIDEALKRCGCTQYYRRLFDSLPGKIGKRLMDRLEAVVSALKEEFAGVTTISQGEKDRVSLVDATVRAARPQITKILSLYYKKLEQSRDVEFFGNPDAPLVGRKHWIPTKPVELSKIDKELEWIAPCASAPPFHSLFESRRQRLFDELRSEEEVSLRARDDATYRLIDVKPTANGPKLVFAPSRYSGYVDTCEALLWESAKAYGELGMASSISTSALAGRSDDKVARLIKRSPWRKSIDDIFDLTTRDACAGVNTLCVLVDRSGAFWMLHNRQGMTEAQKLSHVLPAGTFQPFMMGDQDHRFEFRLRANVFREFCEEVLCKEEEMQLLRRNTTSTLTMSEFYRLPPLVQTSAVLDPFFSNDFCSNWFLGLGLDLCTLKPELLTLLIIDRERLKDLVPDWPMQQMKNLEGPFQFRPFNQTTLEPYAAGAAGLEQPMLAAGSAAIQLVLSNWKFVDSHVQRILGGKSGSLTPVATSGSRSSDRRRAGT